MERVMNLVGYDSPSRIMVVLVHRNNAQNLCVVLRHHLLTFSTEHETLLAPSRVAYSLQRTKSSSMTSDCVAAVLAFILDRWKTGMAATARCRHKVELVSTSCRAPVTVNTDRPDWRRRGNGVFFAGALDPVRTLLQLLYRTR